MAARVAIAPLQYRHSLTRCPHHKQPFVVALGTYLGALCPAPNDPLSDTNHSRMNRLLPRMALNLRRRITMPLILLLAALFTFWPRYDLFVSVAPHTEVDTKVAESLLSLDSCISEVGNHRAYDYVCMKWSPWSQWTNKYTKYDSKHS